MNLLIQSGDHQQSGKREGVAQVLLNIHEDFESLANDPDCSDNSLKGVLREVASSAQEVEESARSNPNPQNGRYWHNDFAETDLGQGNRKATRSGDRTRFE